RRIELLLPDLVYACRPYGPCRQNVGFHHTWQLPVRSRRQQNTRALARAFRRTRENRGPPRHNRQVSTAFPPEWIRPQALQYIAQICRRSLHLKFFAESIRSLLLYPPHPVSKSSRLAA